MRKIHVSFGGEHLARVTGALDLEWSDFTARVLDPKRTPDKKAAGWYCPAKFEPAYRDSEHLVYRDALTLDYDHVTGADLAKVQAALKPFVYVIYTTASHTPAAPRVRIVMPTTRSMTAEEFCAVSRKVASWGGIELAARESHVPAQMMYMPTAKPGAEFKGAINKGAWLNPDVVLEGYDNWQDHTQWPRRSDGDTTHNTKELPVDPRTKPGVVGDFCRAFTVPEAIERFELPYVATANSDRWTYKLGSVAEGAVLYDDGLKLHSHHDTDPARGQHNAFDLVRLHRFSELDAGQSGDVSITERPSYAAMVKLALAQPEVRKETFGVEPLPDDPEAVSGVVGQVSAPPGMTAVAGVESASPAAPARFEVVPASKFATLRPLDWIIKGLIPRAELMVVYGESGSGKSFLALDLAAAITRGVDWQELKTKGGRVVYICAEGASGFRQRLRAYAKHHAIELTELPDIIPDAPNLASVEDVNALLKALAVVRPVDLVVVDTLSATVAGANENSGEDMGRVLSHCKAIHKTTGGIVMLIHHSGKDKAKGSRGWSGIKAAADAEIEVVRMNETRIARVSKMKDGSDGSQWAFELVPLVLGTDSDGDALTSCVVEVLEEVPVAAPKVRAPRKGSLPDVVHTIGRPKILEQDPLDIEVLVEIVHLDRPHKKRSHIRDAIHTVADVYQLWTVRNSKVSLAAVPQGTPEEFDDEQE